MKTLYIDCNMGAAGDMLTAALLELLPEPESFVAELNGLGIPGVVFSIEKCQKCGISGTHMAVKVHGQEEGPILTPTEAYMTSEPLCRRCPFPPWSSWIFCRFTRKSPRRKATSTEYR